jgi:stress response protein YsnF
VDRISALRNVEDALADFEDGDASLEDVEDRVLGVLRTYATEFDEADGATAYRATGDPAVEGTVVVAPDAETARERIAARVDGRAPEFEVAEAD